MFNTYGCLCIVTGNGIFRRQALGIGLACLVLLFSVIVSCVVKYKRRKRGNNGDLLSQIQDIFDHKIRIVLLFDPFSVRTVHRHRILTSKYDPRT